MSTPELETKVTTLVAATIEESSGRAVTLESETELLSSGLLDSLTVLQLFVALQDEFGVELDVDDLTEASFGTPRAIAGLIEDRQF